MLTLALLGIILSQSAAPVTVAVDPDKVIIPRWQGFGCSLSWWAVFTQTWPEASRRRVCRLLFSTDPDCLGLNVVRYNAGGSAPDADARRFRPGGKVQVTLDADGSFHPERDAGQLACLRLARRYGAGVFELFANSPPHWMLRNGDTHGGDGGGENLKPECEEQYALWLLNVAERVGKAGGVRFASVEPFNEPSASWWRADKDGQEGCRVLPEAQARILKALRTEMDRRRSTSVIACSDENDARTALQTLEWLTDPSKGGLSANAIGRVNVHSYSGWEWQERLREAVAAKGIPALWMSEVSHREWENAGYVPDDMRCALPLSRAMVNDLKRLRPSAWVYWQAIEPLQFCMWYKFTYGLLQAAADAPVERQGRTYQPGEYIVSKAFWTMMQFSRFLRPEYRFIETDDFWTVAALSPDGRRLVIVVHHDAKAPRSVRFDLKAFSSAPRVVGVWRTMDDTETIKWNCRRLDGVTAPDSVIEDTLPGRSVTTYVVETPRTDRRGPTATAASAG